MKIGLITDCIIEKPTGIGNYSKYVISGLEKVNKDIEYTFIDYKKTEFNKKNLLLIENKLKYFRTYLWHNLLPFRVKQNNFDYVINFFGVPHWFPYKQKELFLVYDISWYLFPQYHPRGRVVLMNLLFKKSLVNSNKIIVDSHHTKQDLINTFKIADNKIFVIYPDLPEKIVGETKPKVGIESPYILYIGTLEPRKNIESIIRAYKLLKDKNKIKHKLVICGKKGWIYDRVFNLIKTFKLESEVIYLGYITDQEKKYLFKHAEFFIFPSYYEGFGIPVLEAMMYGCPVITSNVSSLPEVVGNAGLTVNPHNINDIVNAMKLLIRDKKLRINLKKQGFMQVKKLSNKNQLNKLMKSL